MNVDKENALNVIDLSRSLQQKETEIEFLQQTFTEIGSELDLERIFQIVSERALELIDAETLLIPLLDDNCETYTYRGGAGKNIEEIVGESLPLDFGVCGWVWKQKKPWWQGMLNELSEDEKNKWEKEVGNMILVPLQGKQHFLGGIAGLNKKNSGSFGKKDLHLLQLFASIVSIAIENAMAVKNMEDSYALNEDYRYTLEHLNKQLTESNKALEQLSLYDSITALPNRSLFSDRLSRDIVEADSNGNTVGILLIDIDSFKDVNDTLGHDQGDILLNMIARRFDGEIKINETLARFGGDEFIVVLPAHDQKQTIERAEKFIESLKDTFTIEQNTIVVNASIGVALYPEHGDSIASLFSHADFAMYEAKNSSVKICAYDPNNDHLAQGHLAMVADIRKALDEKQFELHYQPKISAKTGEVISAEALGRWHSQNRGNVPPSLFIRVLEQNGLIDEYTYWAIGVALAQAKQWQSCSGIKRIAVNLSPQTLMHPDFKKNIKQIIKNKIDGQLLTFEITENLFLSEFDRLTDVLKHVCSLGVELSIDDYGTGYSSLSRLRRLPVCELKIDQTFIKEMADNKDDEAVVHSTIELAHNLGLSVVAEGVENKSAQDLLIKLGCDTLQGFLISKPLPVEKFNAFLAKK
ncbi:diguanylate cyclase/phosphodiesterase (GGDEF & EAL domains) with PAS/PAC sensor(s) [hydrothermal vent metagenome]|uniref:Diguanylate cyclase/phosphodiesterase (GGDEF & EAL domains) with PAS/PAC sensor(S) n=1 Tax=hydrothermal vent metagenome TaxID=652676 RepID=A0A3B0X0K1_9ZZZZ